MFTAFCEAAGLQLEPADVVMLDPSSATPPPPDLLCEVRGCRVYFELGEVVQQDLEESQAVKTRRRVLDAGVPLSRLWAPLGGMLTKKLTKPYSDRARPAALVLYYREPPWWEFLRPLAEAKATEIQDLLSRSAFDAIWLFDAIASDILFYFSGPIVAIATFKPTLAPAKVPSLGARDSADQVLVSRAS